MLDQTSTLAPAGEAITAASDPNFMIAKYDTQFMPAGVYVGTGQAFGWRKPTDAELLSFLTCKRPHLYEDVDPVTLRRVMADYDGELLALMSERRRLQRVTPRKPHRKREHAKRLDHNLQLICETPVCTDLGVYVKARLLIESCWNDGLRLSTAQRRQLLWAITAWSFAGGGTPIERRPVDMEKIAKDLRSYGGNK